MTTQATPKRVATYPHMTEQQLLDCVVDLAHACNWRAAHFRPARTERGWRTPVAADGAGWPDLVLIRGTKGDGVRWMYFVELKSDRGHVSSEQQAWLDALYPYSCVWRPVDWHSGKIAEALR